MKNHLDIGSDLGAIEKTHSQTSGLASVRKESSGCSSVSEAAIYKSSESLICISPDSDLSLTTSSQPSSESEPSQVTTPVSSGNKAKVPLINELDEWDFTHLRARFIAGESDIVKFSHVAACFGYETAVRWAKRDGWKVNV